MSAIFLFMSLFFLIWAYTGPCDWISRLDFDVPPVVSDPHVLPVSSNNETYYLPFAIVGDTQRTSFWECAIGREVNDAETVAIVRAIASSSATFLVILGDMVFDGGNKGHWQFFDKTILPLRHKGLPILPVVGNHEYWGDRAAAKKYVQERFPQLQEERTTWYSKQHGNLGLIWLNSNHDEMSSREWQDQNKWFKKVIDKWDSSGSIKGILLFAHHPPYTNSIIVSSDLKMRNEIVDVFCKSSKAIAMVTGHAHGYERFESVSEPKSCAKKQLHSDLRQNDIGKDDISSRSVQFIVSAGGGGPRPRSLRKDYQDAFPGDAPRPFNFILVKPSADGVKFSTYGLHKGQTRTQIQEDITFSYSK